MNVAALLPWHRQQWQSVIDRLQRGQFPHALLLHGAAGVGKALFAGRLARLLLCTADGIATRPCGSCCACHLTAAGSHPDLFELELLEGKKQLIIEQIRSLIDSISLTAYYGGYKVAIINPAGGMSVTSANALLKTLEEPPEATVLLLVVDRGRAVLPTIRSRCQRLMFPLPQREQALTWLHNVLGSDATQQTTQLASTLLDISGGAPLLAQTLYDAQGLTMFAALNSDLQALTNDAQRVNSNTIAAKWQAAGASQVVSLLHRIVAHLVRALYAPPGEYHAMLATLPQRVQQLSARALLTLYHHTETARFALLSQPMLNERLLIETLTYAWQKTLEDRTQN